MVIFLSAVRLIILINIFQGMEFVLNDYIYLPIYQS